MNAFSELQNSEVKIFLGGLNIFMCIFVFSSRNSKFIWAAVTCV
jgi:hypothetical protein